MDDQVELAQGLSNASYRAIAETNLLYCGALHFFSE